MHDFEKGPKDLFGPIPVDIYDRGIQFTMGSASFFADDPPYPAPNLSMGLRTGEEGDQEERMWTLSPLLEFHSSTTCYALLWVG